MSQKMKSLSSTGSFIEGGGEGVVPGGVVRAEPASPCFLQLVCKPGRVANELILLHPAKEGLARDFAGVSVALGQLLLDELLNWLCDRDFHVITLAQDSAQDNAKRLLCLCPETKATTFSSHGWIVLFAAEIG